MVQTDIRTRYKVIIAAGPGIRSTCANMIAPLDPAIQYHLPDLDRICALKGGSNPYYEQASAESREWQISYHLFPPKKQAYFTRGNIELLGSFTFPYADYTTFRTCCDLLNLLFALDEISDDLDGHGADSVGQTVLAAFAAPDEFRGCVDKPLAKMTVEFWDRFQATGATPRNSRRFLEVFDNYINSVSMEALLREEGNVLDPDSFMVLRRGNSATRVCLGLVEYILGIDLPDEVWEDPTFLKAYWAVVDMVCWANDLYSYNAEQAKGHSGNNVLTVLMNAKGIDLQTACDHVEVHFQMLMDEFLSAQASVPSFGPGVDENVARFISSAGHWAKGSIEWSFATERYFGAQNKIIRQTLLETLRSMGPPEEHMFDEMKRLSEKA